MRYSYEPRNRRSPQWLLYEPLDHFPAFRHGMAMDFVDSARVGTLVTESEKKVFELFETMVRSTGQERTKSAVALANLLGNPGEFCFYIDCTEDQRLIRVFHLLRVFRENMTLLINKTWADGMEHLMQEQLLADLARFVEEYRDGRTVSAFRSFVGISRQIPSLLFGSLGKANDFLEYAFRIDPKFGLFFWYIDEIDLQLRNIENIPEHRELFDLEVLIGTFVLSCF
ncbi:MAG TPA: hypothetical protein DDZ37_00670 [Spirochaetaceae bacterium]|nr:hypothetical protein [Spirochaetaceae bacterium]